MTSSLQRILSIFVSIMLIAVAFPASAIASSVLDDDAAFVESDDTVELIEPEPTQSLDEPDDVQEAESGDAVADTQEIEDDSVAPCSDDMVSLSPLSTHPVERPEVSLLAKQSKPSISARTVYNETKFQAAVLGGYFDTTAKVMFAVWSEDKGQDDLRWYLAPHMPDGSWAIEEPIANHRSTGRYIVHAYAETNRGLELTATASFLVSTPKASAVRLFQLSAPHGTFTVYADDVSGAPIKEVRVAVWAATGGQDDLRWYGTQKIGRSHTFGSYMSNHKGQTGKYYADVYATLSSGLEIFVGRSVANLTVTGGTLSYRNDGDRRVTVSCRDGIYGLASGMLYAVWSTAGGQDDLIWYRAYKQPDRSWPVTFPISNHKTAGKYIVHVYGEFPGGMTHIGSTSFQVTPNSAASVKTSLHDNNLGCFLVTVSGVKASTGISAVRIPVWTKSNQSDIKWYQGVRQSNGDYTVCIQATDHGLSNAYFVHAYVVSGNGVSNFVGQASGTKLNLSSFTKVTGDQGSGSRAVWMKNPPANVNYVYVWSVAGGQDDLFRVAADHMGERNWRAKIDCHNLKHAGSCYADIYSGGKFYKRLTFNVSASDLVPPAVLEMNNRVNGLSSRTGWLIAVDTSNCFVQVYTGSQGNWHVDRNMPCAPGKASTPTRLGIYTVGIKGYVFGHGYSCYYYTQYSGDYLFHSIKYNPGTFDVQDGTMGRPASEGCIRLWLENAKYIYDNVPSGTTVLLY